MSPTPKDTLILDLAPEMIEMLKRAMDALRHAWELDMEEADDIADQIRSLIIKSEVI